MQYGHQMSFSTLFGEMGKSNLFPSIEEFRQGLEQQKYEKEPFVISSYNVEVFNMMDKDDRDKYCKLMMKLTPMAQNSQCVVCKNDLQLIQGSSWQRYVEWFEYRLNNKQYSPTKRVSNIPDSISDEQTSTDNGLID